MNIFYNKVDQHKAVENYQTNKKNGDMDVDNRWNVPYSLLLRKKHNDQFRKCLCISHGMRIKSFEQFKRSEPAIDNFANSKKYDRPTLHQAF